MGRECWRAAPQLHLTLTELMFMPAKGARALEESEAPCTGTILLASGGRGGRERQ